jgi:hypothetical protein
MPGFYRTTGTRPKLTQRSEKHALAVSAERAVMHRRGLGRTGLLPGNHPFFEVIVPSVPGFGFSTPLPENPDMNFWKVADLWHTLMTGILGGTEIRRSVAI